VDYTGTIKGDGGGTTSTTGNDTFVGLVDYGAGPALTASTTLTAQDVIDGGAVADKLNLTVSGAPGAGVTLPAATITGIETVNLRSVLGTTQIVTMAAPSGATTLNADRATDAVVFTGLASGASIGSITGGAALSGTYVAGVTAGTFNAQSGVTAGVITVTANADNLMTTLNINSTGAANVLTSATVATGTGVKAVNINATTNLTTGNITGLAAGTAITVTGAATAVNLGALQSTVTSVNSTGLAAGGITATIGAVAQVLTLSGGVNVITTGGVQTGAVTAGAGTSDRLIVAAAVDVAATPAAKFAGFEILQNNVAGTIDASLVSGITSVYTNHATGGFTGLSAALAGAVTSILTNTGSTLQLTNSAGTADVLNLTLQNLLPANAATVVSATGLTVNGFETMNVNVNSGISTAVAVAAATGADQIGFTAATSLKTLTASGAYSVGLSVTGTTAVAVTSINASGLTGSTAGAGITLGGNTGALTVTGSNNNDIIQLATMGTGGTVRVNAGTGNDTVLGTAAMFVASTLLSGDTGIDTISIQDTTGTIADGTFANVTGFEKIILGATTDVSFTVGGYINAIATANGGVLDVTAPSLAITTGAVVVDATALSTVNSMKLSLTNVEAAANAGSITITTSQGADNITIVGTGAGNIDTITISGGTAALAATTAKTINLSGVATGGAISVTTGAGNDVITAAAIAGSYTGGAGADTFTSGAGVDTYRYSAIAANASATGSNVDTISNFATTADKINVLGGGGAGATILGLTIVAGTTTAATMGAVVTNAVTVDTIADVYTQLALSLLTTTNAFAASTAAGGGFVARQVTFSAGQAAGTYLVLNDATASFQAANDIVIKLTGTTTMVAADITFAV